MKKFKKVFAVLLTLAMVLGMSMTVFADTTATITVDNLQENTTLKYVQIVEPDQNSAIGWKFSDNSYANAFMTAYGVETVDAALGLLKKDTADNYAKSGTINSDSKLSTALNTLKDSATKTDNIANGVITVNKAGLYLIVASTTGYTYIPMLAFVAADGSNLTNATVVAKGSEDQVTKDIISDKGQSVEPNQVVTYKATVEYPYYAPNTTNKIFKITDTLTNAKFVVNTENKANSVSIVDENKQKVSLTESEIGFTNNDATMEINFVYDSNLAGKVIEITYQVKVNTDINADGNGLKNKISSTIQPEGSFGPVTTEYEVVAKPVTFKVIKTDESGATKLSGAQFTIYTTDITDENILQGVDTIQYNNQTLYPVRVSNETDTNGECTFNNLNALKTYYVKETKAPEGYSLRDDVYELSGATLVSSNVDRNVKTYVYNNFTNQTVTDTKLSALPSTGGIGTTIFTIGGCAIMVIAAALFFASRRKSAK